MQNQFDPGHLGESLTREIIERRAKPTRDEHDFTARCRQFDRVGHRVEIVVNRQMRPHRDANFSQFQTEPLAVRIELRAGRQFRSDRDDFGRHFWS